MENLGYDFENLRAVPSADSIWDNRIYLTTTFFTVDDVKELFRALTEDDRMEMEKMIHTVHCIQTLHRMICI